MMDSVRLDPRNLHRPLEVVVTLVLGAVYALLGDGADDAKADPAHGGRRIFSYQQADEARLLAQEECKPLVIHFIPDTEVGARQLDSFYSGKRRIPDDLLRDIVIVVVPSGRFAKFKDELGVKGPGGFRTISAYDLSPFTGGAVPTCKSGFR
jgi:hypothetical protein